MALITGTVAVQADAATVKIEGQVLDPTEVFESERPDRARDDEKDAEEDQ
jgi:hypothetical protein